MLIGARQCLCTANMPIRELNEPATGRVAIPSAGLPCKQVECAVMSRIEQRRAMITGMVAAVLAAPSIVGCSRQAGHGGETVLRVGDQRGQTRSLLEAAGELTGVPYRIEWAIFAVGAPLIEAMKAGAVDFGYVGSSTMTFGLAARAPLKAITTWRMHGAGSGLLVGANSPIRSIADLRGKRIAIVRGSPGHLLVARALRSARVPIDAVTLLNLAPGDAKAALASGSVDAWAIWDPYLAIGEREDHLRVIATSEQFGGEIETGVATDDVIATKRAALLDFLGRVRRGYGWAERHPEEFARAFARDTGLPLDIARLVKSRIHVKVEPRISDAAVAEHQRAADVYADIGVIPRRLDVASVYDRSFVLPAAS